MAEGCKEEFNLSFLKFVLTFNFRNRANIYHTLNKSYKNIIVLRNKKEVTFFLSNLI